MRILLDTHFILWTLLEPSRLTPQARAFIDDPNNEPVFSTASLWEIAIKKALGNPKFQADPRILRSTMLAAGYSELPVFGDHAVAIAGLPPIHKDPFDRLLIAQCSVEGILLLTADRVIDRYPGPIKLL
jgi:PIN domain nuclease of toxin-antitoxin system